MKVNSRKEFFPDSDDGRPRWPVVAHHVVLHLSDGRRVKTWLSGVRPLGYSQEQTIEVVYDLAESVERKLGHHVVEIDVVEQVHRSLEARAILLPGARRTFEHVRVTAPVPDTPQAPDENQQDGPPLDVLAGAPERKQAILESKDSRYILTLTGSKVLSPAGVRHLLQSNPFGGVE